MKYTLLTLAIATSLASPALADNKTVESALQNRSDLSTFYKALVYTGVNHELQPGRSYTVFAPTNKAFSELTQEQYPCMYEKQCQAAVAQIVRNHIVPGSVNMSDAARRHGGIYALNGRFVNIATPARSRESSSAMDYSINGKNVTYMSSLGGGRDMLYKIDGVIAKPSELASLQYDDTMAYVPTYAPTTQATVRETVPTIPGTACESGGCPDTVERTTTVTTYPSGPLLAEPAQ